MTHITIERAKLEQVLEALKTCDEDEWHSEDDFGLAKTYDENKVDQAIASCEQALAQPVPLCEAEKLEEHKRTIAKLQLEIKKLNDECTEIYGLLALAHLNIKQHLQYGFNPLTAKSTLISVGQYYPKLKAEMEKNT